jgi:hypothetical protein
MIAHPDYLLNDLDIEAVSISLDKTETKYGRLKLVQKLKLCHHNIDSMIQLNKKIHRDIEYRTVMRSYLKSIHSYQDIGDIWFNRPEDSDLYSEVDLFNNKYLLNISNKLKFTNSFIIILIYFCIYVYFYAYGVKISIMDYANGIFEGYKTFCKFMLSMLINNGIIVNYISLVMAYSYIAYQGYTIYSGINTSINHYKKCHRFSDEYNRMVNFINIAEKIYADDKFMRKTKIEKSILALKGYFYESHLGHMLSVRKDKKIYARDYNVVCNYIGDIDLRLSISTLLDNHYTIPKLSKSILPRIKCVDMWHPALSYEKSISNSIDIKNNNMIVLTGPNKSGKTTLMKTLMINILIAQSLGISPCVKLKFTPFNELYTSISVPGSLGRESLFEAEANRCLGYVNKLDKDKKILGIIDELFTGTSPLDGMACSKGVIDYIKNNAHNSITLISTHFTSMLPDLDTDILYYKFSAHDTKDGYVFPYTMTSGISDQVISIQILKEKGYNHNIIKSAIEYVNKKIQ